MVEFTDDLSRKRQRPPTTLDPVEVAPKGAAEAEILSSGDLKLRLRFYVVLFGTILLDVALLIAALAAMSLTHFAFTTFEEYIPGGVLIVQWLDAFILIMTGLVFVIFLLFDTWRSIRRIRQVFK